MKNEVEEAADALVQSSNIGRSFRREDFPFSPLQSDHDYRARRANLILSIKTTQMESIALPWASGGEHLFSQQLLLEHALDQLDAVWENPLPRPASKPTTLLTA